MFHYTYEQYEVDIANAIRQRKLEVEAQYHRRAGLVSETRVQPRQSFRSWLRAMRMSFEARLQPVEDHGYIA